MPMPDVRPPLHSVAARPWSVSPARKEAFALFILGLGIAIPSLSYPFGRDQSLFHYVAREWLHGRIPYRDTFDQKPPLIYVLHAIGILALGRGQWVIRAFDMVAVAITGWAAVRLTEQNGRGRLSAGYGFLIVSLLYYVYFDFWDTAQIEIWEGMSVVVALWSARSCHRAWTACACAGLFLGVAVMLKFNAALFLPLVAVVLACRLAKQAEIRSIRSALALTAVGISAMALPLLLMVGIFAYCDGLPDMCDVLIGYNLYYALNKRTGEWATVCHFLFVRFAMSTIVLAGTLVSCLAPRCRSRGERMFEPTAIAAAGWCLGVLSVLSQGKYYGYHWGVLVPFQAIGMLILLDAVRRRWQGAAIGVATLLVVISFATAPDWIGNHKVTYPRYLASWRAYLIGEVDRYEFVSQFKGLNGYSYQALEIMGLLVAGRARPGDGLHVHGFEPIPYVITGLRSPSRFFAEFPLIDGALAYRRQEWATAHQISLELDPPRFVVDFSYRTDRISKRIAGGYHLKGRAAQFVLLERD